MPTPTDRDGRTPPDHRALAARHPRRAPRAALALIATLLLLLISLPARALSAEPPPASAKAPVPAAVSSAVSSEADWEEEEWPDWEDWEAEEEEEEEEEEFEECLLRTVKARVFAYPSKGRLRLEVRYTAYAPVEVAVDGYRVRGARGALRLPPSHKQLGRYGVLRRTDRLTGPKATKARFAKTFAVTVRVPNVPGCAWHLAGPLKAKR